MLVPEPAELSDMATLEFCASISSHLPRIIVSEPLAGKPPLECFSIIPEHVVAHGGEQLNGWAIWIHPRVFVEAEFHAVWRDDAGELHDLTPRILPTEYITFLPDRIANILDGKLTTFARRSWTTPTWLDISEGPVAPLT